MARHLDAGPRARHKAAQDVPASSVDGSRNAGDAEHEKSPVAAATATGAEAEIDAENIADSRTEGQGNSPRLSPDGPFASNAEILWRAGLTPIPLTGDEDGKPPMKCGQIHAIGDQQARVSKPRVDISARLRSAGKPMAQG